MLCFRLLDEIEPAVPLRETINYLYNGSPNSSIYIVDPDSFKQIPNAPFAYWVSERMRRLFTELPSFENKERTVRVGLQTSDDFRFLRLAWESPVKTSQGRDQTWYPFAKGGSYSPFYADIHLKVNWRQEGKEIRCFGDSTGVKPLSVARNTDFYFRPGLFQTLRASRLAPHLTPPGCIFGHNGFQAFSSETSVMELLALMNSTPFEVLYKMQLGRYGFAAYIAGTARQTPMATYDISEGNELRNLALKAWSAKRNADTGNLTSHVFIAPALVRGHSKLIDNAFSWESLLSEDSELIAEIKQRIDNIAYCLYNISEDDRIAIESMLLDKKGETDEEKTTGEEIAISTTSASILASELIEYSLGTSFGRWDIRYSSGELQQPVLNDPLEPLPVCPHGMLQNHEGLPSESDEVSAEYPLRISWIGILVDDENNSEDIVARAEDTLKVIWRENWDGIEQEACGNLGVKNLRDYFSKPGSFFSDHLKRYSKSRRQAPIYWPLQPPSGSYTLWVYYHRLHEQSLYTCINDFVEPKLNTTINVLNDLRHKSSRSNIEEKELVKLSGMTVELKDFRDELLRIAKFWKPNLNDGVQITAAPLWKLFQHKAWQKKLKETWEKLEKGDYDWAHLALSIWPERVLLKCHLDRSLAIAHDVEDDFWEEVEVPVIHRGKDTREKKKEWQPKNLNESELKKLIEQKMADMK